MNEQLPCIEHLPPVGKPMPGTDVSIGNTGHEAIGHLASRPVILQIRVFPCFPFVESGVERGAVVNRYKEAAAVKLAFLIALGAVTLDGIHGYRAGLARSLDRSEYVLLTTAGLCHADEVALGRNRATIFAGFESYPSLRTSYLVRQLSSHLDKAAFRRPSPVPANGIFNWITGAPAEFASVCIMPRFTLEPLGMNEQS